MRFRDWLFLEDRAEAASWLDREGKVYPIPSGSTHSAFAKNWLGMEKMLRDGWQRVTYIGHQLYTYNPNHRPNDVQLEELKNIAIENRFEELLWDNEVRDIVLWRRGE